MKKTASIIAVTFLLFIQIIPMANAWPSGYFSYPFANNADDYDVNRNYGTLDWIANGAMKILYDSSPRWKFLWNMRFIYFLGTESPQNPNLDMIIDGVHVKGIGDYLSLKVVWVNNHSVEETITPRVIDIENKTVSAFREGKYELAAYYCGVLSAYVSYAFYYPIFILNDYDFWPSHSELDDRIYPYTSDYKNPTWFFQWNGHTLKNETAAHLMDKAYEIAWDETYDLYWYRENITKVHVVKDWDDLIENYNGTITYGFYRHYQRVLNLCVKFVSDILNTVFLKSGAEGGDIYPKGLFDRMESKWKYIFGISAASAFGILVYIAKNGVNKKRLAFWRRYKVHE